MIDRGVEGHDGHLISIQLSPKDILESRIIDFDQMRSNTKFASSDPFRLRRQTFPLSHCYNDFGAKKNFSEDCIETPLENMKILQIFKRKESETVFSFGMSDYL